jgi:hypothetical protein
MAVIAPQPVLMSAAVLVLGTDNYELAVSSAQLVPTTPTQAFKGIGGGVINIAGVPTWVLNLNYAQDIATAKSLSQILLTNVGKALPFTLRPVAGGPGYSGSVLAVPGPIGGDVDAVLTGTAALPVNGQPTQVAAA